MLTGLIAEAKIIICHLFTNFNPFLGTIDANGLIGVNGPTIATFGGVLCCPLRHR